jgi:hypothetical protein
VKTKKETASVVKTKKETTSVVKVEKENISVVTSVSGEKNDFCCMNEEISSLV